MSWFSRIFRRNRDEDADYGDIDYAPVVVEANTRFDASPANLPRFTASANAFDSGGLMARRTGDGQRSRPPAFLPSQPVASAIKFAGRGTLLTRVVRAIQDQHLHVIIYGDRGIGKTSVLRVVQELAESAHYSVYYVSCGEEMDFSDTFRAVAAKISALYDSAIDPTIESVERGGTLADRLPAGNFTVSQFSDVLTHVAGTRILIFLDEFDRVGSMRFRAAVAELIKNLSDRSMQVQLVLAGVAANVTDLVEQVPSIRRNIVGIPVLNMVDDEIRELIAIGEKHGDVRFGDDAIRLLTTHATGLPYLASLIAQHACLVAGEQGKGDIAATHVTVAIGRAAEEIGSRLSPGTAFALAKPANLAPTALIVRAAAVAVRNGGVIADSALLREIAQLDGAEAALFVSLPQYPEGALAFREDGASSYAWLVSNLAGSASAPPWQSTEAGH